MVNSKLAARAFFTLNSPPTWTIVEVLEIHLIVGVPLFLIGGIIGKRTAGSFYALAVQRMQLEKFRQYHGTELSPFSWLLPDFFLSGENLAYHPRNTLASNISFGPRLFQVQPLLPTSSYLSGRSSLVVEVFPVWRFSSLTILDRDQSASCINFCSSSGKQ
ncbi:hypothetical protein Pelo_4895 [Pelomyxa schiedti]|nr:hypothetical protein Pelo_4895 [Pelomyxa schiedti]